VTTTDNDEGVTQLLGTQSSLPQPIDSDSAVGQDVNMLPGTPSAQRSTSGPYYDSIQAFWTQSNGFRPSDVLSQQATRGNFSLQTVLRTEYGGAPQCGTNNTADDDPVDKGLINLHVATSLFDGFMKHLNPFISQLDPSLHTFGHTRETSSFLLTAVLAVAAKLLRPSLYHALLTHADGLFVEHFRRGSKSTEIIQAVLVLTYWKKPDDSRAWLSVGYAIRMAIELGWHQLGTDVMRSPENPSEQQTRRSRNIERTWLVLFVYDRRYVSAASALLEVSDFYTA
jgi:hypothetical protein